LLNLPRFLVLNFNMVLNFKKSLANFSTELFF
jgi:hypothetical protein